MKIKVLLLAAITALTMIPSLSMAQPQVKGAQLLTPIRHVEDLQQVEVGDTIIMSCPKCKTTYATAVTQQLKGMRNDELKTTMTHMCPTCSTTIKTEGVGKNATRKLVHSCNTCGSPEVTCCIMKKDGALTTGMEEKK